jgi:hypothetical protein
VTPAEYWASNEKLQHITPLGERFPEVNLFPALQKAIKGSVFEYGCDLTLAVFDESLRS